MSDFGWKDRQFRIPGQDGSPQAAVATDDPARTNSRTPTAHASSHATGQSDAITPANIGAAPAVIISTSDPSGTPAIGTLWAKVAT